jgi:predicted NBD/HSP70 family sugar kinase
MISEMTGLRADINNDGNVGALGEFHFGAGQGYQHIVYVSIGTGWRRDCKRVSPAWPERVGS